MSLTFALQALLVRHESEMAKAEEDRLTMTETIERLETGKRNLEDENARTVQENRNLLNQLEELNNMVGESDTHVQSLNATLGDTRRELQRMTGLANRASHLESELASMEVEQANLQDKLATSNELQRSTTLRWKTAERTIGQLQDQIDKIERESQEEREKHVEVVGRFERQRIAEKDLGSAAGRLDGAAVAMTSGVRQTGSNVVSHFVKDILQDNANLQMGIHELREMLLGSNAEVESLREQMLLHQPLEETAPQKSLSAELGSASPLEAVPELHVHHHYYGSETSKREKPPIRRRSRRRRAFVTPGHFSPYSGTSTPRTLYDQGTGEAASSAAIAPILKPAPTSRWSTTSHTTSSSAPSSAQSDRRASSVFDSLDIATVSSRPTSSASSNLSSPLITASGTLHLDKAPERKISAATHLSPKSPARQHLPSNSHATPKAAKVSLESNRQASRARHETIPEEQEQSGSLKAERSSHEPTSSIHSSSSSPFSPQRPTLHRTISHSSLISISGMDIHTLRARPSQMFTGQGFAPFNPLLAPAPTLAQASSKPITTPILATGRPAFQRRGRGENEYTRSLLAARASMTNVEKPTLGQKVGGWVLALSGAATVSASDSRAKARLSGVNQNGPIGGFGRPKKAESVVQPVEVDTKLLQEALGEE